VYLGLERGGIGNTDYTRVPIPNFLVAYNAENSIRQALHPTIAQNCSTMLSGGGPGGFRSIQ